MAANLKKFLVSATENRYLNSWNIHYYKFKATKVHHEKKWRYISGSGQTTLKQISI